MKRFLIFMTVLVALMTGCDPQTGTDAGNGSGTGSNTPSGGGNGGATGTAAAELVSMDIADAESIYISTPTEAGETVSAKAGVTARTISERAAARGFTGSVLFKITKEGKAVEISLTWGNEKNENTAQLRPVAVYEAGPDYVITEFYNPTIRQNIGYLINKKTGKAYSLEEVGVPQQNGDTKNEPKICSDAQKNLYYKTYLYDPFRGKDYDYVKIDVTDPQNIKTKSLLRPSDYSKEHNHYKVMSDSKGNVLYVYSETASLFEGEAICRFLSSAGATKILPEVGHDFWLAPDDRFYFQNGGNISRLVIDEAGTVSVFPYNSLSFSSSGYRFEINGELCFASEVGYDVVYSPEPANCFSESFPSEYQIAYITATTQSDTCFFLAGWDTSMVNFLLLRVNPKTKEYNNLLPGNEYEIHELSYSGEKLTFGATRTGNGNSVIGKISPDGGRPEIISETTNGNITYLTPIN